MSKDLLTYKIIEKVGLSETFNGIVWAIRKIPFIGKFLGDKYNFSEGKQIIHTLYPVFSALKDLIFSVIGFFICLSLTNLVFGMAFDSFGMSIMGGLSRRSDMYVIGQKSFAWAYPYIALNLIRDASYDNIGDVKKFSQSFYLDPGSIVRASIKFKPLVSLVTRSLVVFFYFNFASKISPLPALFMSLVLYFFHISGSVFWLKNRYLHGKNFLNRTLTKALLFLFIVLGLLALRIFTGLSSHVFLIGLGIFSVLGFIWARTYMKGFDGYGKIVEDSLKEYDEILDTAENKESSLVELKDSDLDEAKNLGKDSKKEGFAYLNELFFARHKRILRKPVLIKTGILAAVLALALVITTVFKDLSFDMPDLLIRFVPLISYMVCKQGAILNAFYLNCDMGLMPYGFYRNPKNLLAMYKERVISLFKINLIPSAVLITGFLVFFIRDRGIFPIEMVEGSAYILLAGIFFTSLPLAQYYLLQPFDSEGKRVGKLAGIIDIAIYYFSINAVGITSDLSTRTLILGASAFIVIFSLITSLLIVRFGPKTFRVRN